MMNDQLPILSQLYQAEVATEKLVKLGVDIVTVVIEQCRPVIHVAPNEALTRLGGGVHIIRTINNKREVINATAFEGCKLQWTTSG